MTFSLFWAHSAGSWICFIVMDQQKGVGGAYCAHIGQVAVVNGERNNGNCEQDKT